MKQKLLALCVAVGAVVNPAAAHHSNAPHYDRDKPVTLEGTVVEFELVNPHAFLHLEVVDENGRAEVWSCEMQAGNTLRRQGWTINTFVPGQRITVRGIAARRDPVGCSFDSATLADGTTIDRGGAISVAVADRSEPTQPSVAPEGDVPNLAGPWMRDRSRGQRGPGPGSPRPGAALLTPEGLTAQAGYDDRFDDPAFSCSAASITRAWSEPGTPTQIDQSDDRVVIRHEYMDTVRAVHLGSREHPASLTPSTFGHSIGWYEGTTLVIDTVGYAEGLLAPHPGIPHSDALHTVERLTPDAQAGTLTVEWTAEDPKYLRRPMTGETHFVRSPYPVNEYGCTPEKANR